MYSRDITFDTIPGSIRKPGKHIEFNLKLAVRTLPGNLQRLVLIGQRLAVGPVAAAVPVNVFSDAESSTYFGRGSVLGSMVKAALTANPYVQLTCVALDDEPTATAASCTITITGTATTAGSLGVLISNERVNAGIYVGDDAATVAASIKAVIDADPDLPVAATVAAGVVTLTAKNKGELGNQIKVSTVQLLAAGVSAATTAMAGGSLDPDIQNALTPLFAGGHDILASSLNDSANLTKLRDYLDTVSGPLEQRGAIATYALTSTLASATTLASTINSGRITNALLPATVSLPWEVSAAYAAVIAFEEDPARPLNTLPLTGIAPPPLANRLGRTEQENCLYNGVTPLEVGPGEKVQIVRSITTYTKDPQGVADPSLLDITTIRSLDYTRKAILQRWALRFPRDKKTLRTKARVWSETYDVLLKLEELEIVENVVANKDKLIVQDDLQDPSRLNVRIPTDIVNGLHILAGVVDLYL
ncbi:phage tail sheath subtilisin-like domain-containing protein [Chitinibacter sp. S2-10]|uniref:phage tail sheath subtilisin-like domain-containing protein n=1 Tax=Chitinibacter sp. S2-10 TaxID=3373597 RepID=UPI00397727AF